MAIKDKINALSKLGTILKLVGEDANWSGFEIGITEEEFNNLKGLTGAVKIYNGWFDKKEVVRAFSAWGEALTIENLQKWTSEYTFNDQEKTVGLILAGNIPLVGFHDIIAVYLSGHKSLVKLSSDDAHLIPAIHKIWSLLDPNASDNVTFTIGRLEGFDAVIATGSNNTARYFEQYFGKYPNIIRKNRTSVALLTGEESEEELKGIGEDVFAYYGLGCRNVTKLYIPEGYDLDNVFKVLFPYQYVTDNNKYGNNYDYHKAIFLMEQFDVIENGFLLMKNDKSLTSPIGTLFYEYYTSLEDIKARLAAQSEDIQCVVGRENIAFGKAQTPELWDYADGVDTMHFLSKL